LWRGHKRVIVIGSLEGDETGAVIQPNAGA
jgi:hypothetical protein